MRRLLALALIALAGVAGAADLEWAGDFEEGTSSIAGNKDSDFSKAIYGEGTAASIDVQKAGSGMSLCKTPRQGVYAGRARILAGGANQRVRAELVSHMPGKYYFQWDGPEYWVGVSYCLAEWPKGSDIHAFFQIHAPNEVKGSDCDFAGNTLSIANVNDAAQLRVLDNPSGVSGGKGAFDHNKTVYSYNLRNTLGVWQDFVFKFRLSTQGTGYYSVWHNGKLIAAESGLTNVNYRDSCGKPIDKRNHNGPHFGIYGGKNGAGPKTVYMDAAKIAVGSKGYNLVAFRPLVAPTPTAKAAAPMEVVDDSE